MSDSDPLGEAARAELAVLLELREAFSARVRALRVSGSGTDDPKRELPHARLQRCERIVGLLDTRIRLAAEQLAQGRISPAPVTNQAIAS